MKYIQFTVNINQSDNCSIIQYLGVLALLLAFVSPTTYQQSPRDYYQFLNHGYKFGQTSKELSKLKVDVLGKVLKMHVTQLRSGRCPVSSPVSTHKHSQGLLQKLSVLALSMTTNCGHKFCSARNVETSERLRLCVT